MRHLIHRAIIILTFGVIILGFGMHAGAQTPRKTPKPLATPLPVLTDAEIISQADDYKDPVPTNQPNPKPQNSPAATDGTRMKELNDRVKKLEASQKSDPDEKQKRLLLNLDILTRAEQRAESLRKQQFEMIDKENAIKTRLNQIEYESRPEVIERSLQMNGSLRPEEIRDAKRKSLLAEKANLETLLNQIQATRANLDASVQRSDAMVEKLRAKMEKDIDDSLNDDKPEN